MVVIGSGLALLPMKIRGLGNDGPRFKTMTTMIEVGNEACAGPVSERRCPCPQAVICAQARDGAMSSGLPSRAGTIAVSGDKGAGLNERKGWGAFCWAVHQASGSPAPSNRLPGQPGRLGAGMQRSSCTRRQALPRWALQNRPHGCRHDQQRRLFLLSRIAIGCERNQLRLREILAALHFKGDRHQQIAQHDRLLRGIRDKPIDEFQFDA